MSDALEATTRLACFVLFILIGSRVFSLTFYGINGHVWVEELFTGLPGGEWGFLIAVNILVFILGCFIDFFEIAFIVVPLLAPVADKFGIDLVWFGVMLGVNMQTSFLTPPFGFALFYMRSVAPSRALVRQGQQAHHRRRLHRCRSIAARVAFILLQIDHDRGDPGLPAALSIPDAGPAVDPSTIEIELPPVGGEGEDGATPPPEFDLQPAARSRAASRRAAMRKGPAIRGPFRLDRCAELQRLLALLAHHEGVVGVLRHLEPQILVGAERHHRVVDLLERARWSPTTSA